MVNGKCKIRRVDPNLHQLSSETPNQLITDAKYFTTNVTRWLKANQSCACSSFIYCDVGYICISARQPLPPLCIIPIKCVCLGLATHIDGYKLNSDILVCVIFDKLLLRYFSDSVTIK